MNAATTARLPAQAMHWLRRRLARHPAGDGPQTTGELLSYARQIEHDLPGLAADLRAAVMRQDDARP